MENERYTEDLVMKEMRSYLGKNDWGYIYPKTVEKHNKITRCLQKAGGKPDICDIKDYTKGGTGKAQPEYIITFDEKLDTIIVVECKRSITYHRSEMLSQPKNYAVDGVLYYAKFLKEEYNVLAIAVSGTKKNNFKATTFYWQKGQEYYIEYKKATDIILEPLNYLKMVNGEKIQKQFSLEEIRETAIEMHNKLREVKITEKDKPIFIAGLLIALSSDSFSDNYANFNNFDIIIQNLNFAIITKLKDNNMKIDKVENIINSFKRIAGNPKLRQITLGQDNSILWYIKELECKIKPMMNYSESTIDVLSVFYHEFIKYSGGDGSGLGIVLTPQHITEFMVDIVEVNKNSKVVDICCGSGSFLVSAMVKMLKEANPNEYQQIKNEQLYGIELDNDLFTLAIANMIVRGDGKSNIVHGDCFDKNIIKDLKRKNINIGLINPPYSQKDICELEFVENLLDILSINGKASVIVPMSCAIGTKFKEVRERLFKKHTLKAVFSMPDDLFYPVGTNPCIMLWEAHKAHNIEEETFFGYYKNDGFVKAKKKGRIDRLNRWPEIKKGWINLYRKRIVKEGYSSMQCVRYSDEWLCEAYMETDFKKLKQEHFEKSVKNYLSYLVKNGIKEEND